MTLRVLCLNHLYQQRKHYKQSAEVKAAEEAKEQLQEPQRVIANKKASLEVNKAVQVDESTTDAAATAAATITTASSGRPLRKAQQKRVLQELEEEEKETKEEEAAIEKRLKDLEEKAVHRSA